MSNWYRIHGSTLKKLFVETYGCQMNVRDSEVFPDSVLREDEFRGGAA